MGFFVFGPILQKTSAAMLTTAADVFTAGGLRQSTPQSALIVTTPPTFAGVTSATPNSDGSFTVNWGVATSPNNPVRFEIYAAIGSVSAAVLFSGLPSALSRSGSSSVTFMRLSDGSYFANGNTYTFGVRAIDGVGNVGTNMSIVTATAIASGNLVYLLQTLRTQLAQDHIDFTNDHANFIQDHANFIQDHSDIQNTVSGIVDNLTSLEVALNSDLVLSNDAVSGTQSVLALTQYQLALISGYATQLSGIIGDANDSLSGANLALYQSTLNLGVITGQIIDINTRIIQLDSLIANVSGIEADMATDLSILMSGLSGVADNLSQSIYNLLLSQQNLSGTTHLIDIANQNLNATSGTYSDVQILADTLNNAAIYISGASIALENSTELMDMALRNVQNDIVGEVGSVSGLVGYIEKPEELNN